MNATKIGLEPVFIAGTGGGQGALQNTGAYISGVVGQAPYAQIGAVTSLVFAVGMVAILFAPDTTAGRRSR